MRVNENIKKLREQLGLSQEGFAQLLNGDSTQNNTFTAQTIAEMENDYDLPCSTIYRIAKAAGASVAWLVTGADGASYESRYDAVLRIYGKDDRLTVMGILAMNGYDVGQHKAARTKTGKQVDFFVHAKLKEDNADTSR